MKLFMMNFFKSYIVNALSLVNIIFSFIFTLSFAKIYKVGVLADGYFYSLLIYGNIILFVQLFYSTFFHMYLNIYEEDKKRNFYYLVMFVVATISIILIGIYNILISFYPLLQENVKYFLDIYIYTILVAPLIDISLRLLNARRKFYYYYLYPIGRNLFSLIILLVLYNEVSLSFLAYGFLTYDVFFFIFIIITVIKLIGFKRVYFDKDMLINLFKKSFLDKTGQFFIGLPELIIGNILTQNFQGVLSIYSYIKKFVIALIQFIFTPQLTIFSTNVAHYINKNKFSAISLAIQKLWIKTIPYYVIASILLAVIIKYILAIFLTYDIVQENIFTLYTILVILFVQNMFVIFEYPYGTIINQKLLFNYALKIKLLSFIVFMIFFIVYEMYFNNIQLLLSLGILPGVIIFIFYKSKSINILTRRQKHVRSFI